MLENFCNNGAIKTTLKNKNKKNNNNNKNLT